MPINLDNESIEKLGIKDMPKVGDSKVLNAIVKVRETSQSDGENSRKYRRINLQITDMSLEDNKKTKNTVNALCGEDKK